MDGAPDDHNRNVCPGKDTSDSSHNRGSSFNGKVVFGIGTILVVAAAGTLLAMASSQSPQIHLSTKLVGTTPTTPSSSNQLLPEHLAQSIDKKFVLVQEDFGWNGTFGGPPIRVNKGDVVQITVINAGAMAHNFGIAALPLQSVTLLQKTMNMPLPDRVRYLPYSVMAALPCPGCVPKFQEGHIDQFMQPDTQQVTTFTASQAGQFKYFCMVRGHLWLGMVGDFDVADTSNLGAQQATTTSAGGSAN